MEKYIDAEKLKKSISNYAEGVHAALNPIDGDADYYNGKIDTCKDIQEFIESLQRQQEADLEKEIDRFWDSCIKHKNERGGNVIWCNKIEIEALARYFAEWGAIHFNARKEE